jgi:hypothetical protein
MGAGSLYARQVTEKRFSSHYGVTSILPLTRTVRQLDSDGVVE